VISCGYFHHAEVGQVPIACERPAVWVFLDWKNPSGHGSSPEWLARKAAPRCEEHYAVFWRHMLEGFPETGMRARLWRAFEPVTWERWLGARRVIGALQARLETPAEARDFERRLQEWRRRGRGQPIV
jgi:hypothetical protein